MQGMAGHDSECVRPESTSLAKTVDNEVLEVEDGMRCERKGRSKALGGNNLGASLSGAALLDHLGMVLPGILEA